MVFMLTVVTAHAQTAAGEPFAVVELFSSQGCSNCPPADELLIELNKDAINGNFRVFTLSFQVDYWNRLGWKDPYSAPQFSLRQQKYANALRSGMYTPQMIINGQKAFLGADGRRVRKSISEYLLVPSSHALTLQIKRVGPQEIEVMYHCDEASMNMTLNFALVKDSVENKVARGENSGLILRHEHVVRVFKTIALSQLEATVTLEHPGIKDFIMHRVIAYIQDQNTMKITAAGSVDLTSPVTPPFI